MAKTPNYAVDFKALTARYFPAGNANSFATEAEDTVANASNIAKAEGVTAAALLAFYNKYALKCGQPVRSKFENKTLAAEAVLALLVTMGKEGMIETVAADTAPPADPTAEVGGAAPSRARKQPTERKVRAPTGSAGAGRAAFAGKMLYPTATALAENYRRAGSAGYAGLEIVRAHPQGILFEDYLKLAGANGAGHYVKWDIEHGGMTLTDPGHAAPAPVKPAKGKGKSSNSVQVAA